MRSKIGSAAFGFFPPYTGVCLSVQTVRLRARLAVKTLDLAARVTPVLDRDMHRSSYSRSLRRVLVVFRGTI